jgi:hypothetical protein
MLPIAVTNTFERLRADLLDNRSLAAVAFGTILVTYYISRPKKDSKGAPISDLPGPKRSLLLGNLKNFPKKERSAAFNAWREEFGKSCLF